MTETWSSPFDMFVQVSWHFVLFHLMMHYVVMVACKGARWAERVWN